MAAICECQKLCYYDGIQARGGWVKDEPMNNIAIKTGQIITSLRLQIHRILLYVSRNIRWGDVGQPAPVTLLIIVWTIKIHQDKKRRAFVSFILVLLLGKLTPNKSSSRARETDIEKYISIGIVKGVIPGPQDWPTPPPLPETDWHITSISTEILHHLWRSSIYYIVGGWPMKMSFIVVVVVVVILSIVLQFFYDPIHPAENEWPRSR